MVGPVDLAIIPALVFTGHSLNRIDHFKVPNFFHQRFLGGFYVFGSNRAVHRAMFPNHPGNRSGIDVPDADFILLNHKFINIMGISEIRWFFTPFFGNITIDPAAF